MNDEYEMNAKWSCTILKHYTGIRLDTQETHLQRSVTRPDRESNREHPDMQLLQKRFCVLS
jgi:hypothetical protein